MFASIQQRRNIQASEAKTNDSKGFSQDSQKTNILLTLLTFLVFYKQSRFVFIFHIRK